MMITYLGAVYDNRLFWTSLAMHDIRRRYRRSILGMAWAMLQPLLLALVISLVLGRALHTGSCDYFLYVLTGLCFWHFLTHVVSAGCQSIRSAEAYILQHHVPMAVYPLRFAIVGAFHFVMAMIPAVILTMRHGSPQPEALLVVPLAFLLLVIFGWSMATIFGITNLYFPDTQHFCQVGLTILFYSTPIIWQAEMLRARGLGWLIDYNPLAAFVDLFRSPLLHGTVPSTQAMLLVLITIGVSLLVAALLLATCERKIIFRF